jgi:TonB family protein
MAPPAYRPNPAMGFKFHAPLACLALLLAACASKGDEMRAVVPVKTTYLSADAVDGGAIDLPPRVLREVRPAAPAGITGDGAPSVVVRFVVDPEGRIGAIEVVRADDDRLKAPAIAAISRWRVEPAQRGGRSIPVAATVQLSFDVAPPPAK